MSYDRTFATATHIITILAYRRGEWVNSARLATSIQTNPGLVRRILSRLAAVGMVETRTGVHGGARLRKQARALTLGDVYEAVVEKPVLKVSGRARFESCPVSRGLEGVLNGVFGEAEEAMKRELNRTTIEDIVRNL